MSNINQISVGICIYCRHHIKLLKMFKFLVIIFSMLTFVESMDNENDVITGLVRVARCRAGCVTSGDVDTCWDLCHTLANVKDTSLCHHDTCGHVCRRVCHHYALSNSTPDRRKMGEGPGSDRYQFTWMPKISGCSMSWSPLSLSSNIHYKPVTRKTPGTVYLVLGQDRAGQWYEVIQTQSTFTSLSGPMTAKLDKIVVLGIMQDGVQDSVIIETNGVNCELEERRKIVEESQETELLSLTPKVTSTNHLEGLYLTEISLIWNGVVDDSPRYLIQWQRVSDSLDVVGSMVISDTTAQLTLDTDSFYVVTVRDIHTRTISPPTVISTSASLSPSSNQKQISVEVIILIVMTILCSSTFAGIYLHRRFTKSQLEENQNNFNKEVELKNIQCLERTEEKISLIYRVELMVKNVMKYVNRSRSTRPNEVPKV